MFRIILTGRDSKGYTYEPIQRLKAGLGLLSFFFLLIALYTAIRRSFDEEFKQILPESVLSAELTIRTAIRGIFESAILFMFQFLQALINNAWLAVGFFAIALLILLARRD